MYTRGYRNISWRGSFEKSISCSQLPAGINQEETLTEGEIEIFRIKFNRRGDRKISFGKIYFQAGGFLRIKPSNKIFGM